MSTLDLLRNSYTYLLHEADQQQQDDDQNQDPNAAQPATDQNADAANTEAQEPEEPEGYETTPQQTPANAQEVQNKNAPSSLTLADGTDTNIPVNTQDVSDTTGDGEPNPNHEDLEPKEGEANIAFEDGDFKVQQQTPAGQAALNSMNQTVLPLCEKALIELLGNSGAYHREDLSAVQTGNKIDADITYHCDLYIGNDIDPASVTRDQNYIYNTIKVIPGLTIRQVRIDTSKGDIHVDVSLGA